MYMYMYTYVCKHILLFCISLCSSVIVSHSPSLPLCLFLCLTLSNAEFLSFLG